MYVPLGRYRLQALLHSCIFGNLRIYHERTTKCLYNFTHSPSVKDISSISSLHNGLEFRRCLGSVDTIQALEDFDELVPDSFGYFARATGEELMAESIQGHKHTCGSVPTFASSR